MELVIPQLQPNQTYSIQLRATSRLDVSEWSPVFTFTTGKDTVAPLAPSNLQLKVQGGSMILTYQRPTLNEDGSPVRDFKWYEIRANPEGSATTVKYTILGDTFDFDAIINESAFNGFKGNVEFKVFSVDTSDNISAVPATITGRKAPPGPPTNLVFTAAESDFVATWTAPVGDAKDYQIIVSDGVTSRPYHNISTSWTFTREENISFFGSYKPSLTITVKTRDSAGQLSLTGVTATAANVKPAAPVINRWVPSGTSFVGEWTTPTLNADGSALNDLRGYDVRVIFAGTNVRTFSIPGNTLTFSFEDNKAAFAGIPRATLVLEVRARDSVGQLSDPATATATNSPPAAPAGLVGTSNFDAIFLKWTANTEDDLANYEVWVSTVSATDAGTLVSKPKDNFYNHETFSWSTDHWLYVKAVAVFNSASAPSTRTGPHRPKNAINVNVTAPATPTGLAISRTLTFAADGASGFVVNWTAVPNPENDLAGYTIRYYKSGSTVYEYLDVPADSTSATIAGLAELSTYLISIRAYDFTSNRSTYSSPEVSGTTNSGKPVVAKTDGLAPATSPTPVVNTLFGALEVKWPAITNADPVTYEVHASTTTNFVVSSATKSLEVSGTFAIIKTLPGSSTALTYGTTYFVKIVAKDADGIAGAGTQASGVTSQVDNGDLAVNAVRANNILAGSVVASKLNVSVGGDNLWVNSSFENSVNYFSSWSIYSNDGASSSTKVGGRKAGTFAARISWTLASTSPQGLFRTNPDGFKAGQWYSMSFWARASGAPLGRVFTNHHNVGPSDYLWVENPALADGWQRYVSRFRYAANTTDPTFWGVNSTAAGTNFIEFDDLKLEEGEIATNYSPNNSEILPGTIVGTQIQNGVVTTEHVVTTGLDASVLRADTAFTRNLNVASVFTLGTAAGGIGEIKSFNYNGSTSGFQLTSSGLNILSGTVAARALQIQEGSNIMPAQYAGFEFRPEFYAPGVGLEMGAGVTASISSTSRFETQALQIVNAISYIYFAPTSNTATNIPVEPNTNYIFSWYAQLVSGAVNLGPVMRKNSAANLDVSGPVQAVTSLVWVRQSATLATDATTTAVGMYFNTTGAGTVLIDGLQLEKQEGSLTTPSQWKPPGLTRIDGGIVRTGEIRSTSFSPVGDTTQPAWSLNTQGNMQINDGLVRGKLIVGSANNTGVQVASANYGGAGSQWAIKGDGSIDLVSVGAASGKLQINGAGLIGYDTAGTRRLEINTQGQFFLSTTNGGLQFDDSGLRLYSGATLMVDLNRNGTASFNGNVTALTGNIGGWAITSNSLSAGALFFRSDLGQIYGGDGANRVGMRAGYGFWAGTNNHFENPPFRVNQDGYLYSRYGVIGGFTLNGESGLFGGSGATRVHMQPNAGFWAGADAQGNAPFYVTQGGFLRATNVEIHGYVNATSGVFSGTVYASGGSFQGNVYAGLFRSYRSTAGSGNYIEIGDTGPADPVDEMRMYYNGTVSSIRNPSTAPGAIVFSTGQGHPYHLHPNPNDGFHTNGAVVYTRGGALLSAGGVIASGGGTITAQGGQVDGGVGRFQNGVFAGIYWDNPNVNYFRPNSSTALEIGNNNGGSRFIGTGGTANGGTKTFVIDHPKAAKKGTHYLVHNTVESPTADVVYRGRGQLAIDGGWDATDQAPRVPRATITLPDYFEDLTAVEGRTVIITPIIGACKNDPTNPCNNFLAPTMGAGEVVNGQFKVYELAGYSHPCCQFYWEVKAVRKDVVQPEVEPEKTKYVKNGDGPYTYLTKKV